MWRSWATGCEHPLLSSDTDIVWPATFSSSASTSCHDVLYLELSANINPLPFSFLFCVLYCSDSTRNPDTLGSQFSGNQRKTLNSVSLDLSYTIRMEMLTGLKLEVSFLLIRHCLFPPYPFTRVSQPSSSILSILPSKPHQTRLAHEAFPFPTNLISGSSQLSIYSPADSELTYNILHGTVPFVLLSYLQSWVSHGPIMCRCQPRLR